jgi:hypothetical protein
MKKATNAKSRRRDFLEQKSITIPGFALSKKLGRRFSSSPAKPNTRKTALLKRAARLHPEHPKKHRRRAKAGEARLHEIEADESRKQQEILANIIGQHNAEQNHNASEAKHRTIDRHERLSLGSEDFRHFL